jgi:hypothetical protein
MIDLEKIGSQIFIQNDIETQELEAHRALSIRWLASAIVVQQIWLDAQHRFHNDVLDLQQQGVCVMPSISQSVDDRLKASLVALIIQSIFGMLELAIILIDRVVSQVNEHIIYIGTVQASRFELFCGKTNDSLVVKEDLQGIAARYQDIKPDIKF